MVASRRVGTLVFFGKGRVFKNEKSLYDPRVKVVFQPNAYVDTKIMTQYIADIESESDGETRLLILDSFKCHITPAVKAQFTSANIITAVIPGRCTKYSQPLHVLINKLFKKEFQDIVDNLYTVNREQFVSMNASERRIALTKMLADAWTIINEKCTEAIKKSFVITGIATKLDGSEDERVKIVGYPYYGMPGQPAEDGGNIISNSSTDEVEHISVYDDEEMSMDIVD